MRTQIYLILFALTMIVPMQLHAQKSVRNQHQARQSQSHKAIYNAYMGKLDEYARRVKNEENFRASYFLHDMTGDGIPELCVFAGEVCPMDFPGDEFSIYFYRYVQGKLKYIGKYDDKGGGMATSVYYLGKGYILNVLEEGAELFRISYYKGKMVSKLIDSNYNSTPSEPEFEFTELSDRKALNQLLSK
ncbi:MAG: hypothetical protein IKX33_01975 [Prevotella sp.]|nr:hypothetical protein [Prevotella sp.]